MIEFVDVNSFQQQCADRGQAFLLDVRSPSEYATGHIPGAFNVPMEQLESKLLQVPETLPVVLICKGGHRARMAADLVQPCRQKLTVLSGGTDAWIKAGFPLERTVTTRCRWNAKCGWSPV